MSSIYRNGILYGVGGASGSGISVMATLLAASWNAQTKQQTVTFTGYQASMNGVIGVPASATDAQKEAYASALVRTVAQNGNQFTFECESIPSIDLPVMIYAGGSSGGGADALDDLTDVELTSPADGDLLQYNSTSGEWENSSAIPQKVTELQNTYSKQDTIADVESTSTSSKAYAVGDLLYYDGVLYKVTTAIAQGESIITSGSGKNVEVTSVDAEFGTRDAELSAITNVYGSKNVYDPSSLRSDVVNGLTFSVSDKGALNIQGTCTASGSLRLTNAWSIPIDIHEFVGRYITAYDDTATLAYVLFLTDDNNHSLQIASTKKQGALLNFNPTHLYIAAAFVADTVYNTTVYPMLRDAAITDTTFEPYAKTNLQLTEDMASVLSSLLFRPRTDITDCNTEFVGIAFVPNTAANRPANTSGTLLSFVYRVNGTLFGLQFFVIYHGYTVKMYYRDTVNSFQPWIALANGT